MLTLQVVLQNNGEIQYLSTSRSSLSSPTRLAFDFWQNLWVADTGNNRILMFKADRRSPELFDNCQPASLVLGQKDFTTNSALNPPTSSSLNQPGGITFD